MGKLEKLGGPGALAFGGLGCARAWLSLVFVAPGDAALHFWFDLGYVALAVLVLALARYWVGLSHRRWPYLLALISMLVTALGPAVGLVAHIPSTVRIAVALAAGVGFGIFCLLNAESYVRLDLLHIVLYMAANHVFASLLVFVLAALDPLRMTAALMLLSLGAVGLVRLSFEVPAPLTAGRVVLPLKAYPWKLYLLVGLFSFVYGLRQASMVAGAGRHSGLSTALLMGAVFIWALYLSHRFTMVLIARFAPPLMVLGLLLVLLPSAWGTALSAYCVSLSSSLVLLAASVMTYAMSQRTGVAIVPLNAALTTTNLAIMAGSFVGGWMPNDPWLLTVVTCVVAVVSLVLLFLERGFSSRWANGVLLDQDLGVAHNPRVLLDQRCGEVAATFGLTDREGDVLRALVGSWTNRAIANELGITPGTLKTHVRHIYEKTGVHSREELGELVGVGAKIQGTV